MDWNQWAGRQLSMLASDLRTPAKGSWERWCANVVSGRRLRYKRSIKEQSQSVWWRQTSKARKELAATWWLATQRMLQCWRLDFRRFKRSKWNQWAETTSKNWRRRGEKKRVTR